MTILGRLSEDCENFEKLKIFICRFGFVVDVGVISLFLNLQKVSEYNIFYTLVVFMRQNPSQYLNFKYALKR